MGNTSCNRVADSGGVMKHVREENIRRGALVVVSAWSALMRISASEQFKWGALDRISGLERFKKLCLE